jgi:NAD(P)-dependent dehydrogenase (short-subunit alcohol dehydrogenase family)
MDGTVALVTGAGSGIGRATAHAFAARGARVALVDIDEEAAQTSAAGLDVETLVLAIDMRDGAAVRSMVSRTLARFGRLDFFHNNAGIAGPTVALHDVSDTEWDSVMDINLRGTWLGLKAVVPHMRSVGRGAIVNTASVAGTAGFRHLAPYCASKAGVIALTRVAALENGAMGIRVNAVCPGMIATPMAEGLIDGPSPSNRLGAPTEIAEGVVWLCSESATYVNGTCLTIDGGWTAAAPPRRARPLSTEEPNRSEE